jgi:hypothetical protein
MLGEVIKLTVRKKEDGRFDGELGRMRAEGSQDRFPKGRR